MRDSGSVHTYQEVDDTIRSSSAWKATRSERAQYAARWCHLEVAAPFAGIVFSGLLEMRWNPPPPRERYLNNPDDWPVIAFWNMFSSRKWTPEGITFHARQMLFTLGVLVYSGAAQANSLARRVAGAAYRGRSTFAER